MRAFTKAAALLLVQSVAAESMPAPVRRVSATETIPTAYITLNVPVEGAEPQVLPLRLDLVEADEPCSPAQVSVNGRRLTQDADGFGQGDLTLDDGITITSNWTFACQSLKQALTINVLSINGSPAFDPSPFTATFYQTTPVQIASVENVASVRYLHLHTTVTESLADSGEEHSGVVEGYEGESVILDIGRSGSVEEQLSRLKELRNQARDLAALIRDQEATIMDRLERKLQAQLAHEPAPTPLSECRDVRCVFKALEYRFRHSHDEVCESASGWRAVFGCAPKEQPWEDEEDFDMVYLEDMEWVDDVEAGWEDEETFYAEFEESMLMAQYEATRSRMLLLVAESAVIFGSAVFLLTAFLRRLTRGRRIGFRRSAHSELPLYQESCYFDEPKTLVAFGFVDDDVNGKPPAWTGYRDEEKALLLAADEAAANKTTVADEIAELREAASVVSDLVAVDAAERRRSSVDYDDEAPPAYERGAEREHSL
ncbi:hypothetical protein ISF_03357 [Cordyceps fumosorosea ARSEF 2679]|uniref:Uncharacterized protein n=1 Tax=Cordyceps fumosorosea (strain ARSEF 2679) TaxID=1081104 RepID=A0A162JHB2_CORFA|nr:hypothetical protein ISF_03357 [Cordyceps fumosorosea ARSEF 2679]OAA68982.1 hypothetical protein ISF_03357 [Cordyceps fumosorosea ARSEF 2679]